MNAEAFMVQSILLEVSWRNIAITLVDLMKPTKPAAERLCAMYGWRSNWWRRTREPWRGAWECELCFQGGEDSMGTREDQSARSEEHPERSVKNAASGKCKMCLQDKPLVSSHLMPAALYDYCRMGEHSPLRVGGGIVLPTDRQTQDFLLCKDCEDVLNRGGETWVNDKLATREKTFPLYDILVQRAPDFDEDGFAVYFTAKNPHLKAVKLTHFALGIFWKASVHAWSGTRTESLIELGPYSDKVRMWLRGENQFPNYVYLVAVVARPERAQPFMTEPYEGERSGWRTFNFCVPGLAFMLNVGKTVDEALRALCIHNSPEYPISVADWLSDRFQNVFAEQFHEARKTKSFLKSMAKIAPHRKPK